MSRATHWFLSLCIVLALPSTSRSQQPAVPAFNPADVDTTCKPCENFYKFATEGWKRRTPIPAAFAAWGSFDELTLRNLEVVRGIAESAARDASTSRDRERAMLGHFYSTCMDSATVESRGMEPIRETLDRIDRISTRADLRREIGRLAAVGTNVLFASFSRQDERDSRRVIFNARQGGLGLPDKDYYTKTDTATVGIRDAYRAHVVALLRLTGIAPDAATSAADRVLALESALAGHSLSRVEMRDPTTQYYLMPIATADTVTPGWSWGEYYRALGLAERDSFNLAHPRFFRGLAAELEHRDLADWKAYLRFHVVNRASGSLSSAFVNQGFAYTARLSGARELQPRWRRCLGAADGLLSDILAREYVKTAYTPAAKRAMDQMIDNLLTVYRRRIQSLSWMGEATRREALKKVETLGRKVGYPDQWRSYDGLVIDRTGWHENLERAVAFATRRGLAKVGKAVDRGEWFMTPPTVNAYYSPANNEIGFPAGRVQPPFFHPAYDLGSNYGGIGATIGHEISHGFDDSGRRYDSDGNLRDWWTADDATRFGQLAGEIERQYTGYMVLDSLRLNGKQTLGENIADNAGVSIAYEALQLALQGQPRTLIDGFTPEQRFFLGWAQARRTIFRDAQLRLQVQTGVHSPGEFRVNGPLSNMPEFAMAFGCKAGDPMVRANPVKIW
jgi:putative endopeptidase